MTLRPWKRIKLLTQIADARLEIIGSLKVMLTSMTELTASQTRLINIQKARLEQQEKDIELLKAACISHSDPQLRDGEIEPPATKKYIN